MKTVKFRIVFDIENEVTTVFLNYDDGATWFHPCVTTKELLYDEAALKSSIPGFIEGAIESYRLKNEEPEIKNDGSKFGNSKFGS